ncbi:MAG: CPBP family intramembrane glutamic endopeptidase [Desulfotignum sp.]|nr:CPBP family intramembrane glutamic endopeptidase [Desulfotignum sp.]
MIGIPLIFIGGSALQGNLFTEPFPFASLQALLAAMFLAAIKDPVEEFGWRGLALPLLQRKFAPLWAGLILGAIWGLWHLPAFLVSLMNPIFPDAQPYGSSCLLLLLPS